MILSFNFLISFFRVYTPTWEIIFWFDTVSSSARNEWFWFLNLTTHNLILGLSAQSKLSPGLLQTPTRFFLIFKTKNLYFFSNNFLSKNKSTSDNIRIEKQIDNIIKNIFDSCFMWILPNCSIKISILKILLRNDQIRPNTQQW